MSGFLKKFVTGVLIAVLACAFCACGGSDNSGDSVNPDAPLSGSITVWWPGADAQFEAAKQAKKAYEQEHEGVTINLTPQPADNFYTSYAMVVGKKNEPDLLLLDSVYIQVLAYYFGDPALADLSSIAPELLSEVKDTLYSSLYNTGYYGGDVYALPYAANTFGLAYNRVLMKNVLDTNGIQYTDIDACVPTKLGSEQEEYSMLWWCKQVNDYNRTTGKQIGAWTIPSGNEYASVASMQYVSMLARLGGSVMNDDFSKVTICNDEYPADKAANAELETIVKQLGATGVVSSTFEEAKFEEGKVLFIEEGCWKIAKYDQLGKDPTVESIFNAGWADLITLKDGYEAKSCAGLYSLAMSRRSKNKALALDFMKYLIKDQTSMLAYAEGSYQMPALKAAFAGSDYYNSESWQMFGASLEKAVVRPGTGIWSQTQKELSGLMTAWLKNGEAKTLDKIQTTLAKDLKELYS